MSIPSILDLGAPVLPNLATLQTSIALRLANNVRNLVTRAASSNVGSLIQGYKNIYDSLWTPTDKYKDAQGVEQTITPQQVCDALGDRAVSLFALANQYGPALLVIAPDSVPAGIPAGKVVTPHEDGTVTIIDVVAA